MTKSFLDTVNEKGEIETFSDKIRKQLLLEQRNSSIVIADSKGRIVGNYPKRTFLGLGHLINTGYKDD